MTRLPLPLREGVGGRGRWESVSDDHAASLDEVNRNCCAPASEFGMTACRLARYRLRSSRERLGPIGSEGRASRPYRSPAPPALEMITPRRDMSGARDMTQDTEARRSAPRRRQQSALPGIGPTVMIAVISGVVCWVWLAAGRANPAKSIAPNMSELTQLEDREIAGALTTINSPNALLARFREQEQGKEGGCRLPLASVSLVSAPGQPPGHIRLISGTYVSPVFEVSAAPVRVAIPFPAPYEIGHGILTAMGDGGSATIALLPAWRVSAADGKTTHAVTWTPVKNCGPRNG